MSWLTRGFAAIGKIFAKSADAPSSLDLRQGSAEFEYFIAKAELDNPSGNLSHGVAHLAELLRYDPACPEWRDLLEAYLARARGQEEGLLPESQQNYYAIEAVRAFIFARRGRLEEAVRLLNAVIQAKPDAGYMDAWGPGWLGTPGAVESLPRDVVLHAAASALMRFPEYPSLTCKQERCLSFYIGVVQRMRAASGADSVSIMVEAGLLRKAGRFEEALAMALTAVEQNPDWRALMALGLTLRAMGRTEEAEAAFRRGLAIESETIAANLEIADMHLNLGEWARALAEYELVLQREPRHPWAYPSVLWCRWKMSESSSSLKELIGLAGESNGRADALLVEFRPYAGYIPEPQDALANVFRQVQEQHDGSPPSASGPMNCRLNVLEAPSNQLPFKLLLGGSLKMRVETVQTPDPRAALGPAPYVLWNYDGCDAEPALPPPSEDVARRIATVAMVRVANGELWAAASRAAARLGESGVAEILSVMVHPPAPPEGVNALAWVVRVQWAAAFVIANLGSGWEGSPRRDALYSVLFGPRDWATQAAIAATARLALEMPAIAVDVGTAFERVGQGTPDEGYYYQSALYWHWLSLPHLFEAEKEELREKLKALEK
jgi:tetratricopeptide (TPR) repeat protein